MLPDDLATFLATRLDRQIRAMRTVGGGCIAHATRVETDTGSLFVKWSRDDHPDAFVAEAAGLRALHAVKSDLSVPEPLLACRRAADSPGFLVLEWIEPGKRGSDFWDRLGGGLAQLHRHEGRGYGFDDDNYIGRLPQANAWRSSWPSFFAEMRLEPQVRRAHENGLWDNAWTLPYERMVGRLGDLLPAAPEASLLHGDLWGGNVMVTVGGAPVLIDPAAYYGHREADLAMTELFGGFERRFYDAYRDAWPLSSGYDERRDIYDLYHLINHLNHFGTRYAEAVGTRLDRF